MSNINLLPPELTIGSSSLRFSKLLKKINFTLGIIIALALVLLTGAVVLFNTQARRAKNSQQEVETQILVLKETEQRLVLIRDRLEKISEVLSKKNSDIKILKDINSRKLVTLDEADIKKDKSRIEIGSRSLRDYTEFLEQLIADESYTEIELTSFVYTPRGGYDSELNITRKDAK